MTVFDGASPYAFFWNPTGATTEDLPSVPAGRYTDAFTRREFQTHGTLRLKELFATFPLALLSGLFLILDLGVPLRFWHMILYSKTFLPWPVWDSPISVGAYALLLFGLFSFLSFLDVLVETGRLPWAPMRALPGTESFTS